MNAVALVTAVLTAVLSVGVMSMLVKSQRARAEAAFGLLASKGPMTLDELAVATGANVVMKGYLMNALDELAAEGKLVKTPPPKGHPALRIARDTRYGLPSSAAN